jgi:hypothetical protein
VSNTLFWRCEDVNLDPDHDHSVGDTTATVQGTSSISATAAKIGSSGILNASGDQMRFSNATNPIVNRFTGAMGFWLQFPTTVAGAGQLVAQCVGSVSTNNNITFSMLTSQEVRITIRDATVGAVDLDTTTANLAAAGFYFLVARWDQPNNKRFIGVYDSSLAPLDEVEDLVTSYTAPAELGSNSGLRIGGGNQVNYIDNVFVDDAYDAPLLENANITSWTEYSAGGIAVPTLFLSRSNLRMS